MITTIVVMAEVIVGLLTGWVIGTLMLKVVFDVMAGKQRPKQ